MALNNKNTVMISGQEYAFKTGAESKTIQALNNGQSFSSLFTGLYTASFKYPYFIHLKKL